MKNVSACTVYTVCACLLAGSVVCGVGSAKVLEVCPPPPPPSAQNLEKPKKAKKKKDKKIDQNRVYE